MKITKCDLCGKTIDRPDMLLYDLHGCVSEPNRLRLEAVDNDGCVSTRLHFDLCENCGKRLYNELKTLKKSFRHKIYDVDDKCFNHEREYREFTNKPDA